MIQKKLIGALVLVVFGVVSVGAGAQSTAPANPCGGCNQPPCPKYPPPPPPKECKKDCDLSACIASCGANPGCKSGCCCK